MEYQPINMYGDSSNNNNNNNNKSEDNNNTTNGNPVKKTKGKQKIPMRTIEKDSEKKITFSKRRGGIYKKASELVSLTACEIGFLVFSPTGKALSFAHPSFDHIAKRFPGHGQPERPLLPYNMEGPRQVRINQLTETYNDTLEVFDTNQSKVVTLKGLIAGKPTNNWWNRSIDDVVPEEIQEFENVVLEVFNRVEQMKVDILMLSKNDDNNNN
ncbi:Agamous-like MADS-box protein AGL62 [Linum perenne]